MGIPITLLPADRTSVTYTIPASTSLVSTLVRVDFTSASRVTGLTFTLALSNTCCATAPHGTCGWHSATLTPDLARSASVPMCAGLLGGTAISITFLTKLVLVLAPPALTTWVMFLVAAEANTTAGAPWLICNASAELAPKLSFTFTPGCAASNCLARVVNASVSEAAASPVMVPLMAADDEPEPPATTPVCRDGLDELQPVSTSRAVATSRQPARVARDIGRIPDG